MSCIYCGSNKDMTVDHIPPKSLFPEPRPSNMLTVPCCKTCNKSFSKDDEYFRNVLVSHRSVSSNPNAQAVNQKLLRSMSRPKSAGMAKAIRNSLHIIDIQSQGGIYLGKTPAIQVSAERINRTIDRIARGLYYIICGYPVPSDYEIKCSFRKNNWGVPKDFIEYAKGFWKQPKIIGNNVFSYSYAPCIDDLNAMLFIYWFYDKLYFYGYVSPIQ